MYECIRNVHRIVKDQAQIMVTIKMLYRHNQDRILDDQILIPVADDSIGGYWVTTP